MRMMWQMTKLIVATGILLGLLYLCIDAGVLNATLNIVALIATVAGLIISIRLYYLARADPVLWLALGWLYAVGIRVAVLWDEWIPGMSIPTRPASAFAWILLVIGFWTFYRSVKDVLNGKDRH